MRKHPALLTTPGQRRPLLAITAAAGVAAALTAGGSGAAGTRAAPASQPAAVRAAAHSPPGTWQRLPAAPIGTLPFDLVSVWTGQEMIIHGIVAGKGGEHAVAFAYHPGTRTWRTLPRGPRPATVEGHDHAVWTRSQMLVLGPPDGGAYNPATNTWHRIAGDGPDERAVMGWTGTVVLQWGGICCDGRSHDGEAYDPATDTWTKLPVAPLQRRRGAMGAWTGKELVVAGGMVPVSGNAFRYFRNGAAYNPATGTWRRLPLMPRRRAGGTALWDGKEVLFFGGGGSANAVPVLRGMAYNPATNRWRRLPAMHFRRDGFAAVWTGRQVLVWGGLYQRGGTPVIPPHGEAYNPATNRWTALPASPLHGRMVATSVWTGHKLIVWGGGLAPAGSTTVFTDGAAYTPRRP